MSPDTPVVTTVHELQLIDDVPIEDHDRRVSMFVTLERIIRVTNESA